MRDTPVTLAAITGAHGVTGDVRLKLFGEGVASLKPHAKFNGGSLTLEKLKDDGKGGAIARFAEVPQRDPDGPGPAPVMSLPGTLGAGDAGVDLTQLFAEIAWADRLSDTLTWGVSGIFTAQSFEATGTLSLAPYTQTFARSGGTASTLHSTSVTAPWAA